MLECAVNLVAKLVARPVLAETVSRAGLTDKARNHAMKGHSVVEGIEANSSGIQIEPSALSCGEPDEVCHRRRGLGLFKSNGESATHPTRDGDIRIYLRGQSCRQDKSKDQESREKTKGRHLKHAHGSGTLNPFK